MKFISQLLENIQIQWETPIKVEVDNIGAIFSEKKRTPGERAKQIDIKYHYVREMIDKGFIELEFVKSEDNTADIFTNNLGSELYSLHSEKLLSNR